MDYRSIYETQADAYDSLVSAEDTDGNLLPALAEIQPMVGRRVIEVGAGTGRISRLLATAGAIVIATEPVEAMLAVAARVTEPVTGFHLCCAEGRSLPLADASADAGIAGWVFGHYRAWEPDRWRFVIGEMIAEIDRVVEPGGAIIVVETLGTGTETPAPPPDLAEYYAWLEVDEGFTRTWIRTDYDFATVAEAASATGFFFGEAFATRVRANGWSRVPESTGIWWRGAS